jgi:hypothetical protein
MYFVTYRFFSPSHPATISLILSHRLLLSRLILIYSRSLCFPGVSISRDRDHTASISFFSVSKIHACIILPWYKLFVIIHRVEPNTIINTYRRLRHPLASLVSSERLKSKNWGTNSQAKRSRSLRFVARFFAAAFLPSTLFSSAWSSAPCVLCSSRI